MKKKKKAEKQFPAKRRYEGVLDAERKGVELSGNVVSSTEMTGAVPAAPAVKEHDQTLNA